KEQVKVKVSKILPKIEKTVNEQLETEILNRSSNSSKISHAVATDLSELELNLYKALVDAYECDKLILDTYGDTVTLKRRRDNEDKYEEPFAGSNRGDDQMFITIKLVSRHQNTQQFGAMLPVELTNEDIRSSAAYKEYYGIASGAAPPKTKESVRKTQSSFDTTMPPPMAASTRLSTSAKGKQHAKSSKAKGLSVLSEVALTEAKQMKLAIKRSLQQTHISRTSGSGTDEGTGIIPGVLDVPTYESDEEISWKSSDEDDDNDVDYQSDAAAADDDDDDQEDEDEQDDDDQDDNDDDQNSDNDVENSNDESNDDESHGMNVGGNEGPDAKDDDKELYRDVNINLEGRDIQMTDVHTTQVLEDTHVTLTLVNPDGIDSLFESTSRVSVLVTTTVDPLLLVATTLPPPSIPTILQVQQAPAPSATTAPSIFLQDLLNFGFLFGFDHCLKTLEANFSEFMQTNQFAKVVSSIPDIVDRYIDHRMNEAVKIAVLLQSNRLRDEAQAENEDFLNKLDENIQKIIKEQVKEQVKVQVSKISPKIEETVNEKLEAEVSSKRSYAVAAHLNWTLVDAYECDKIILDTYGDTVTLKRRRDDEDKDEEPSAGSDWGSKRRRACKEPESTSAQKKKASKTSGKSTEGSKSHQKAASESALVEEPIQTTQDLEEPSHKEFETGAADDQPVAEASQHPKWFQKQTKPPTPDRAWNKTLLATHGSNQPWISDLAKQAD
nr:hypothetical protein [Tanacetum cinerariifolium]